MSVKDIHFNIYNKRNYIMEIWKDIVGYEGHYQVSNLGRIKSLKNDSELTELGRNSPLFSTYANAQCQCSPLKMVPRISIFSLFCWIEG